MLLSALLAVALVLVTALFHLAVLRWLSGGMSSATIRPQVRVLAIVLAVLSAHLIEITLYGAAYAGSAEILRIGGFSGGPVNDPLDYLYFSAVSYTSLGIGDVFPTGHLRFITGIEALNGLLLIAWSGSFIYLAMGRLWPWEQRCESAEPSANR